MNSSAWRSMMDRVGAVSFSKQPAPPGAGQFFEQKDLNGAVLGVAAYGDAFELFVSHNKASGVTVYTFTLRVVLRLAVWLVWWWVARTLCGLRTRLYFALMRRFAEAREREVHEGKRAAYKALVNADEYRKLP